MVKYKDSIPPYYKAEAIIPACKFLTYSEQSNWQTPEYRKLHKEPCSSTNEQGAGSCSWKWSSWDTQGSPYRMLASQAAALPTALQHQPSSFCHQEPTPTVSGSITPRPDQLFRVPLLSTVTPGMMFPTQQLCGIHSSHSTMELNLRWILSV